MRPVRGRDTRPAEGLVGLLQGSEAGAVHGHQLPRPEPDTARAFLRANKVTYPSLADNGGRTLLALRGKAANTPTTLVLDRQGRLAARVAGQVSRATLDGLVDDVLGEGA